MTLVSRSRDTHLNAEQYMAMREREFLQCVRKQDRTHICVKKLLTSWKGTCFLVTERRTTNGAVAKSVQCDISFQIFKPKNQIQITPKKEKTVDVTIYRGCGTVNSFHQKVLGW